MSETTTPPAAPLVLPTAAFIAGVDPGTGVHAIPYVYAVRALAERSGESGALCGRRALVATRLGAFDRATLPTWATVCPHCAWAAAATTGPTTGTGAVDRELDALTPTGADLEALEQLLADPLIVRHLCEAIIAAAQQPDAHGLDDAVIELLGHASAHAPVLLRSWDCITEECHHPPGACPCSVACAACSLQAGSWAEERESTYRPECTISAPCQVLTTLIAQLNPPLDQDHNKDQDELAAASRQAR